LDQIHLLFNWYMVWGAIEVRWNSIYLFPVVI
jgi:hypothetical protein